MPVITVCSYDLVIIAHGRGYEVVSPTQKNSVFPSGKVIMSSMPA